MDIQFRRKKYGTTYYKVPIFLNEKDSNCVNIAIDYFNTLHDQSAESYNLTFLSQLIGNRKVAKGISSLMFKKYYKISNHKNETMSPSDLRSRLYQKMWKDGQSWIRKDKQNTFIRKLLEDHNLLGSASNESNGQLTDPQRPIDIGENLDSLVIYLFSDHSKFEKIFRKNNKPSSYEVISSYNQEILRLLFSKAIHFTLQLNKSTITSNHIKVLFRSAKLWGIYCEAFDEETNFIFKLTGPKGLIGRKSKYGARLYGLFNSIFTSNYNHTFEKASITLEIDLFNKVQNVWIPLLELKNIKKNKNGENSRNSKNTNTAFSSQGNVDVSIQGNGGNDDRQDDNTYSPSIEIDSSFDSMVEEEFYQLFKRYCPQWKISREPVLSHENMFFLPDFELQFHNQTIYLEIVGFWTDAYLNKKVEKLKLFKNRFENIIILVDEKLDFQADGIPTFHYSKKMTIQKLQKFLHSQYEIPELDHYIKNIEFNKNNLIDTFKHALKDKGILNNNQIAEIIGTASLSNTKYVCELLLPKLIDPLSVIFLTNSMKIINCEYIIQFQQELREFVKSEAVEEDAILDRFSHIKFEEIQELLLFLGYYQDFQSLMDIYFIPPTNQREIIPQIV